MNVSVNFFWQSCLFFGFLAFNTACTLDYHISQLQAPPLNEEEITIHQALTAYVGSTVLVHPHEATPPFSYRPSGSGFLNTSTGEYTIPPGAPIESEFVEVTDSLGRIYKIKVRRRGFKEIREIAWKRGH